VFTRRFAQELKQRMAEMSGDQTALDEVCVLTTELIADWELDRPDGSIYELTLEGVSEVGVIVLNAILARVLEALQSGEVMRASSVTSSARSSSARKPAPSPRRSGRSRNGSR
jgi:hypothetical protein